MKRTPLSRTVPMPPRTTPMPRTRLQVVGSNGATVIAFPSRKTARDTIPAKVRRIVTARDMGLCVHCGKPAVHIHHRRIKGMGGDIRPHANCPCDLLSVCLEHHDRAHRDRFFGLAEGLIVPRGTPLPGLLPVMVQTFADGIRSRAWPSCDGAWFSHEPDAGSAA